MSDLQSSPSLSSPSASPVAAAPSSPFHERAASAEHSAESIAARLLRVAPRLEDLHLVCLSDALDSMLEHAAADHSSSNMFDLAGATDLCATLGDVADSRAAPCGGLPSLDADLDPAVAAASAARLHAAAVEQADNVALAISWLLSGGYSVPSAGELLLRATACRKQARICPPLPLFSA